jgi:hypothetical protein
LWKEITSQHHWEKHIKKVLSQAKEQTK